MRSCSMMGFSALHALARVGERQVVGAPGRCPMRWAVASTVPTLTTLLLPSWNLVLLAQAVFHRHAHAAEDEGRAGDST